MPRAPRPATPTVVLASGALLLVLLGAASAQRAWLLDGWLVAAAIVPWAPSERWRRIGVGLAWAGIAGCVIAIVRVPFGSRVTAALLPAGAAFVARVVALRTERARRWADP